MTINRNWLIYGGIGALVLVGGYYYLQSSSQAPAVDTTAATGATTLPDLTFAAPPVGDASGSVVSDGTTGTDALTALMNAFTGTDQKSVAEINADTQAATQQAGVSVFTSLLGFLKAHQGLNRISATVPQVGTVTIGPQPKQITTVTPAASLQFAKGATTTSVLASNKTRITNLLKQGFKPV